jgi:hypothetical protein
MNILLFVEANLLVSNPIERFPFFIVTCQDAAFSVSPSTYLPGNTDMNEFEIRSFWLKP